MSAQDQQNSDRIVRNIDYLQVLKNRWKEDKKDFLPAIF